ncbi:MAG: redoxin domain-containing protein [Phycisphaerae bacterium]
MRTRNAHKRQGTLRRLVLLGCLGVAPLPASAGAIEDFHALDEQLSEASDAYEEALETIRTNGGSEHSASAKTLPDPRPEIFRKLEGLAVENLGKPVGADMVISAFQWSWFLDHDLDRLPDRFARITKHYPNIEELDDVLPDVGYFGTRTGSPNDWLLALEELLERTTRKETKLAALLARGQIELGQGRLAKAKATFKQVLARTSDTDVTDEAEGFIFEIDRLQPGMQAPDFTARTIDGKRVSLKSLRGKAVLLNFWASW